MKDKVQDVTLVQEGIRTLSDNGIEIGNGTPDNTCYLQNLVEDNENFASVILLSFITKSPLGSVMIIPWKYMIGIELFDTGATTH